MPPTPSALTPGMLQFPATPVIPGAASQPTISTATNTSLMVPGAGGLMANQVMTPGTVMTGPTSLPGTPGMITQIAGAPRPTAVQGPYGLQPLLYWYPSPPVSPQSAYYVHACPTSVIMKGLASNVTSQEVLSFFEGIFEVIKKN